MEKVVLVNEIDIPQGTMEKMQAHLNGSLHRAFSIFLFNEKEELLIHKRASEKYHSGGLWTNTCCSHPRPDEKVEEAAHRRLWEEMGLKTDLKPLFHRIYQLEVGQGLVEHEYDHVFTGRFNGIPAPDPAEVEEWCFKDLESLRSDMAAHPESYTSWFLLLMQQIEETL